MVAPMSLRWFFPLLATCAVVALPGTARAGNGVHPRTPVVWPEDTACMTVVDRSKDATLSLSYTIPYEDIEVTSDEVEDSRRHQFIAFCRDHSRQQPPPSWLSWMDVDAAAAKGLLDPMDIPDEDVFEANTDWMDCMVRITADEERRPITFNAAAEPVEWDTSMLPVGAYVIQGYTWEPIFNIFARRVGVVHVVDDLDVASVGPAVAVTTSIDYAYADDTLMIEGCYRAMPGSTMSGYWSLTNDGFNLDWVPFAEGVALEGESFVLPFDPPPEAALETIAFRVDVTDPMQRTFTAHGLSLLTVLPGSGATSGCDEEASFIADPCETSGMDASTSGAEPTTSASTDPGTGASTSAETPTGTGGGSSGQGSEGSATTDPSSNGPEGCACDTNRSSVPVWMSLLAFGLRRRRRG